MPSFFVAFLVVKFGDFVIFYKCIKENIMNKPAVSRIANILKNSKNFFFATTDGKRPFVMRQEPRRPSALRFRQV